MLLEASSIQALDNDTSVTSRRELAACRFQLSDPVLLAGLTVFFKVILVVVFRVIEFACRLNCRDYRLRKPMRVIQLFLQLQCFFLLRFVSVEHYRSILIADIGSLAIQCCWIVICPKYLQELFESRLLRVVLNLNGFNMFGRVTADLFVRRVFYGAAGVSDFRFHNARSFAKNVLYFPKATGAEVGGFQS